MSGGVLVERALAKINLTLDVLGRRADGFHDLESLVVFARDAFDTIELHSLPVPPPPTPPRKGEGSQVGVNGSNVDQLNVRGPYAAALVGENILLRAQRLLSEHGVRLGSVHLDKQLPIASGIGGGSADAAAMLRAAQRANPELADAPWWGEIAAVLGSDVPVCVASLPTLMTGTGQMMAPVHDFPTLHAVLVNPLTAVPADKSAQVFRALGLASGTGTPAKPPMAPRFRDAADALAYVSARDNRLTAPAATVVPEIPAVLAAISELPGCRLSRMSGAGPTCFGLFESPSAAAAATASLAHRQPAWWVFATRLG